MAGIGRWFSDAGRLALVAWMVSITALAVWAASGSRAKPGVLEATGFRLVDDEGTARGLLGMHDGSPVVELLGPNGKRRVALTLLPEVVEPDAPEPSGAWLLFYDSEGVETVSVYHVDDSYHGPRQGIEFRYGGVEPESTYLHLGSNPRFNEAGALLEFYKPDGERILSLAAGERGDCPYLLLRAPGEDAPGDVRPSGTLLLGAAAAASGLPRAGLLSTGDTGTIELGAKPGEKPGLQIRDEDERLLFRSQ